MSSMSGPTGVAKLPVNGVEVDVDASDVSAEFFMLPVIFAVITNPPIAGGVAPVVSLIVITKVDLSCHTPPSAVWSIGN